MTETSKDLRLFCTAQPPSIFAVPAVHNALVRERDLTVKDLAARLGVSERTITNWRNGQQPGPLHVRGLAEVLSIDLVRLYQALGWLEAGPTTSVEALDGKALAESTVRLLRAIGTGVPGGAAAVLTRALQSKHEVHTFTDVRSVEGGPELDLRDFVGITVSPAVPESERNGTPDAVLAALLRENYELAMRLGPALLEDRPEVIALCQQRHRAQAWFWVPRLVATRRPRERRPVRRTPRPLVVPPQIRTIVVVGSRLTGADRVAALLAREIGWGHINTSIEAQRVFGRVATGQRRHAERALWVGEAVLSSELGDGYVIGHGASSTAAALVEEVGRRASSCLLISMAADRHLVHYARAATLRQSDTVLDERGEVADFSDALRVAVTSASERHKGEWASKPVVVGIDAGVQVRPDPDQTRDQLLLRNEKRLWAAHAQAYRKLAERLSAELSEEIAASETR